MARKPPQENRNQDFVPAFGAFAGHPPPGGENLRIDAPEPCNADQHKKEKRGQERKTVRPLERARGQEQRRAHHGQCCPERDETLDQVTA